MIRYFFILPLIICFNNSFCQNSKVVSDSSNEYLSQMQKFIQENEDLKITDSVKYQNLYTKVKSFIINHPKNENDFLFIYWCLNLGYKQLDTLLKLVDTSIYSSPQKSYADVTLKRVSVAETGKPFPLLVLTDTSGTELSISSLKGKIILLDVWSSWCAPCREEIPDLIKLYKKYNSKGFEVIGISMDDNKQKWLNAIKEDKQRWKAYCELKNWRANKFAARFSVYSIPANFLIDQNGILVGQNLSAETIKYWIQQHL
jgi:thiol-disulfide isomerase/thioredoxin